MSHTLLCPRLRRSWPRSRGTPCACCTWRSRPMGRPSSQVGGQPDARPVPSKCTPCLPALQPLLSSHRGQLACVYNSWPNPSPPPNHRRRGRRDAALLERVSGAQDPGDGRRQRHGLHDANAHPLSWPQAGLSPSLIPPQWRPPPAHGLHKYVPSSQQPRWILELRMHLLSAAAGSSGSLAARCAAPALQACGRDSLSPVASAGAAALKVRSMAAA